MTERSPAEREAFAAAAVVMTWVKGLMEQRGCKKVEDCISEAEFSQMVAQIAEQRGIPVDDLNAALREVGEPINRRKMN